MKVELRQMKETPGYAGSPHRSVNWRMGLPFVMSRSGILVHRLKAARSHIFEGKYSHDSADYWCGNGGCSRLHFAEPPADRLVCALCEAKAIAAGEKSSDELLGRHVHIGTTRAVRSCCQTDHN